MVTYAKISPKMVKPWGTQKKKNMEKRYRNKISSSSSSSSSNHDTVLI